MLLDELVTVRGKVPEHPRDVQVFLHRGPEQSHAEVPGQRFGLFTAKGNRWSKQSAESGWKVIAYNDTTA